MLVVCRLCASEYSIGVAPRAASACDSCEDGSAGRERLVLRPEQPLRLRASGFDRGLPKARMRTRPRWRFRPGRLVALWRHPVLLGGLAACAMMSAVVARGALVSAVPQVAVLYEAAGLPVHIGGLVLREATSSLENPDGQPILVVQGRIENVSRSRLAVPSVSITLRGRKGEPVYGWSVPPARAELAAGEAAPFRGRLAAPPAGIVDVELALATGRQALASSAP